MLSGFLVFFAFFIAFVLLSLIKKIEFPFIFSFAVTPVSIALCLYYIYLLFPGQGNGFYRGFLYAIAFIFISVALYFYFKVEERGGVKVDLWFLLPLVLSSIILFFVPRFYPDYDPLSYALIGKTIFKHSSLRLYPFVETGVIRPVFSYFYHPPVLPLIYSFLYLFKLSSLMHFPGAYFYILLNLLIFGFFKKRYGVVAAFFVIVFFAFTPGFFELSRSNFTGSMRMLFFALSLYYISVYPLDSSPVILSGGFALFSHSIGLLIIPMLFFSEVLKDRKLIFKKHFKAFGLMFFIGGFQYLLNILKFHSLDTRGYLLGYYGSIGEDFIKYQFKQRHLIGFANRFFNGYFNFVFQFKWFGLSFIVSFLLFVFAVLKNLKKNNLVKMSSVFVAVYMFFHFMPLKGGIFIMTYRYIFTIFPVIVLGFSPLFEFKRVRLFFYYLVFVNFAFILLFANPFKQKVFWYRDMKDFVSSHFTGSEKVLVDHLPSFFFYNEGVKGKELMDPDIAGFYNIKDVFKAMEFLKKNGFTHILMPYEPDPFASDTCLIKILEYPFLVTPLKTYYHCSLFKVNYENIALLKRKQELVFKWDGTKNIPVCFYKHKKSATGTGGFKFKNGKIDVYSTNRGFAFAFSRDKVWKKNSCYISLSGNEWIVLRFKADIVSNNKKIFPFLHRERENGFDDLGLKWVKVGDYYMALARSPYFRVFTPYINVKGVKCIAPGVNFYLSGGKVEISGLEIKGF